MSAELRLERLPSNRPEQAVCFLCDEFFEPAGTLAILYDGDLPLGYLCAVCASSSSKATKRVRRRARRILSLLKGGMDDDSAERSLKRMQLIYRRAGYWMVLANRIEELGSWD